MKTTLLIAAILFCISLSYAQQIVINEIMTNNGSVIYDEDGDNADWIELYNNSTQTIDLSGYSLTDDPGIPLKWIFGKYYFKPGEYLLVWASDKNLQAGPQLPNEIPGLISWFNASDIDTTNSNQVSLVGNNIFVKKWISNDDAYYAQQTTEIKQPQFVAHAIGAYPALRFDGLNQMLISNVTPPISNHSRTIMVMLANANMATGNTYSNNHILHYGDNNTSNRAYGLTCKSASSNSLIGNNYWTNNFAGIAQMDENPRFISSIYMGLGDNYFVNGSFAGTNFISLNTGDKYAMRIASRVGNGAEQFAGDIAEIMVYDTSLSREQRRRVENYMALKYQLPFLMFHSNFKLSSGGGFLALYKPDGTLLDQMNIPALDVNYSYGLSTNGLAYFSAPTPGSSNNTQAFTGIMEPPVFSQDAGFYSDTVSLSLQSNDPSATILYTLDGSDPDTNAISGIAFPVKYDYSVCNSGFATTRQSTTHVYNQTLNIAPKYNLPNDRSQIPAAFLAWNPPTGNITKASVVKATCWKPGAIKSKIITKTYFVDSSAFTRYSLPVVSLVTPDANLFDYNTGIYVPGIYYDSTCNTTDPDANFEHDDWEQPTNFELFNSLGNLEFRQSAGGRIHGNFSSNWPRKSIRLEARKKYGDEGTFNYALFPGLKPNPKVGSSEIDEFNAFLIRNSGNNWKKNLFHDAMVHKLVKHLECDGQAYRPVVHFLNGEYWGIMNLREKHDEYYFSEHYDLEPEDVIIANARTQSISCGYPYEYQHYYNLENFISNNSMTVPANFTYANTQMDIENYLTHFMIEIYVNNTDFLGNNRKFWRKRTPQYTPNAPFGQDGRWRWILYDLDISFAKPEYDRLTVTTTGNASSTLILRKLLENTDFKNNFINSFCDNMNTSFLPARVTQVIDTMKTEMSHDITEHIARWDYGPLSPNQNCDSLIAFAQARPYYMRKHLKQRFQLSDTCIITINTEMEKGLVTLNSIKVDQNTVGLQNPETPYPWSGTYFLNVPLRLVANAKEGFVFSHWSNNQENDTIYLSPSTDTTIVAYFEAGIPTNDVLVINEIYYNSSPAFDPGDWVEFYNPQNYDLNISNWYFKDEVDTHSFIFPQNTVIGPLGYLVLCDNTSNFANLFPSVQHYTGNMGFGLSGSGELLRLYNSSGMLVDTVHYDDVSPWPTQPDGNGSTLELIKPELDNALAQSWMASPAHGSPGTMNSLLLKIDDEIITYSNAALRIYPNPVATTCNIQLLNADNENKVKLSVYDLLGNLVRCEEYENTDLICFDRGSLKSGMYLIHAKSSKKMSLWAKIVLK